MSIAEKFEVIADEVYEKGKKDEYDKFWDTFQDYGNRTTYSQHVFSGVGFSFDNFYPKYDIKPIGGCDYMFGAWNSTSEKHKGSLKQRLEECGVTLDLSGVTSIHRLYFYCINMTEVPMIDLSGLTVTSVASMFNVCKKLKEVSFKEKSINVNGIDLAWSLRLSKASIESIVNGLVDEPTITSPTITISETAVKKAFETSEGAADGNTSEEWTNLIATTV